MTPAKPQPPVPVDLDAVAALIAEIATDLIGGPSLTEGGPELRYIPATPRSRATWRASVQVKPVPRMGRTLVARGETAEAALRELLASARAASAGRAAAARAAATS